jgi:hypothetical protein
MMNILAEVVDRDSGRIQQPTINISAEEFPDILKYIKKIERRLSVGLPCDLAVRLLSITTVSK